MVQELPRHSARKSQLRVNSYDDNGDGGCGGCGARGSHSLGAPNNMHTDSRHMDSNERTGADSIHTDNNLGTLGKRCSRPEIQN